MLAFCRKLVPSTISFYHAWTPSFNYHLRAKSYVWVWLNNLLWLKFFILTSVRVSLNFERIFMARVLVSTLFNKTSSVKWSFAKSSSKYCGCRVPQCNPYWLYRVRLQTWKRETIVLWPVKMNNIRKLLHAWPGFALCQDCSGNKSHKIIVTNFFPDKM